MKAPATTATTGGAGGVATGSAPTHGLCGAAALFAALGVAAGAWGAHVPSVKVRYGLDELGVAGVLLAAAAGAVLALFVAGRLVERWGTRCCVQGAGLVLASGLAAVLHMPARPLLWALMLLVGASMSVFDVAVNAEGTALELLSGRKVMARLHALFSVGGMSGAGFVAAMFALGLAPALQLAVLALAVGVAVRFGAQRLHAQHLPQRAAAGTGRRMLLRGEVWLLGLLMLAAMVAEGALYDWSALYLSQELRQPAATAALGFAVFAGAMAVARLGADALRVRWPEGRLLAAGSALCALAMTAALLLRHPAAALAGFALAGVGLAAAVPILFTAATRIAGVPRASAIAAVSAIGYAGFMIGPPLIGALARVWSLGAALGVVVAASATLALFAPRIP